MQLDLSTPALLFPAISLLLLAYTNRFLAVASLIRSLAGKYEQDHDPLKLQQIYNLRRRVFLIRDMQTAGVSSIFCCVASMALVYIQAYVWASWLFGIALVLVLFSLAMSMNEIFISTRALEAELKKVEEALNNTPPDTLLHRVWGSTRSVLPRRRDRE